MIDENSINFDSIKEYLDDLESQVIDNVCLDEFISPEREALAEEFLHQIKYARLSIRYNINSITNLIKIINQRLIQIEDLRDEYFE